MTAHSDKEQVTPNRTMDFGFNDDRKTHGIVL